MDLKKHKGFGMKKNNNNLKDQGLSHSDVDHSLYYLKSDDKIVILILYLDDLLFVGDDEKKMNWLKEQLKARFEMIDLGLLSFYLRREFLHLPNDIFLGQRSYVKKMLEEFGMLRCNPTIMVMLSTIKLSTCMKLEKIDAIFYKTIVRKFFFKKNTKLDITFVVGVVSIYMVRPYKPHSEQTHIQIHQGHN